MSLTAHSTLPPAHPVRGGVLRGRRLLIVQCEGSQRVAYRELFTRAGACVEAVGSIHSAHAALANTRWDVGVVEDHLSDGDGVRDLLLQRRPADPTWVATCDALDAECQLRVYEAGGLFLSRPVRPDTLRRAVELAVRRTEDSRTRSLAHAPSWLNRAHLRVECPDGAVAVTRVEHDLLLVLAWRQNRWQRTDELARHLLARDDRAAQVLVRQYVYRLRTKLAALHSLTIEHSRRRGYRLYVQPDPREETRD